MHYCTKDDRPDITISCGTVSEANKMKVFRFHWPQDQSMISGMLLWLSFQTSELVCRSENDEVKAIATRLMANRIARTCHFRNELTPRRVHGNVVQLLTFAAEIKQSGNEKFGSRRYNEAMDLYFSSMTLGAYTAEAKKRLYKRCTAAWSSACPVHLSRLCLSHRRIVVISALPLQIALKKSEYSNRQHTTTLDPQHHSSERHENNPPKVLLFADSKGLSSSAAFVEVSGTISDTLSSVHWRYISSRIATGGIVHCAA